MAINYRNEPLSARLVNPDTDPAFVFSSFLHGDPFTPLLQAYNGDSIRIRLFQGAHEESHSFNLHRQRWHRNRPDLESELTQQQIIGISEAFTAEFAIEGDGDFDMLYHYGGIDDIWLGAWGIFRAFKERVSHVLLYQTGHNHQKEQSHYQNLLGKIRHQQQILVILVPQVHQFEDLKSLHFNQRLNITKLVITIHLALFLL